MQPPTPDPFLEVRVHDLAAAPGLSGLCVGYELGTWREDQFASHIMQWLPEFALKYSEWQGLGAHNALQLIAQAARSVYTSKKYKKRGEFGEVLLHIAVRQIFKSIPAIAKFYYKDAPNDTVKGFDAVHVVEVDGDLELWLGEVKFYHDIGAAIGKVVAELQEHLDRDYLRGEFTTITNKLDPTWPHADRLRRLLHSNTSLDEVFRAVCIPVLLTYDSPTVNAHKLVTPAYIAEFEAEVKKHHNTFAAKEELPKQVRVHLFLVPLRSKASLVATLDQRLKKLQEAL